VSNSERSGPGRNGSRPPQTEPPRGRWRDGAAASATRRAEPAAMRVHFLTLVIRPHAGNIFVVEWVEVGRITELRRVS